MLLLPASPAQAKCLSIRSVAIRGVDSSPGLHLSREQWGRIANERSPAAVVIEGLFRDHPRDPRPPRRLGPRYRLIHTLDVLDFRTNGTMAAVVEQDLYPRTSDGPMTFTPPQEWVSCTGRAEDIEAEWQPFPDELMANLRSFELPPPAGTAPGEGGAHRATWWTATATGATAIGVGLVMIARSRRRRRLAQADRAT